MYKHYFSDFYNEQNEKAKAKILKVIGIIETMRVLTSQYFKFLEGTNGLCEIKIDIGSDTFRIFCFFDKNQLIVLGNGFQKKTQKTPKKELMKAIAIKKEYENEKK